MKGRESGMPEEEYWNSFFDADSLLDQLECHDLQGDIVEFGCGYGLFTVAAARRTTGRVIALDIDPEMIQTTEQKATRALLSNIRTQQRDFLATGSGCPDQSAVYVMLFNILHIEDPVSLLTEARRVLVPGGLLGVVHWNYDPTTPRGPSLEIRPTPEQCQQWAVNAGFHFRKYDPLTCCPHHYGLLFER